MVPKLYQIQSSLAHSATISSMCIGPRSCRVYATGGEDNVLNLWSIDNDLPILTYGPFNGKITCCEFDNSENFITFSTSSGTVSLLDLDQQKTSAIWGLPQSNITAICEDTRASGFYAVGDSNGHLFVLSSEERFPIQQYNAHRGPVSCVRICPEGNILASCGIDGFLRLFDLAQGRLLGSFKSDHEPFISFDFHPTSKVIGTCAGDRSVRLYDIGRHNPMGSGFIIGNQPPQKLKFSKDGEVLGVISTAALSLFRTAATDYTDHLQLSFPSIMAFEIFGTCVAIGSPAKEENYPRGNITLIRANDFRLLRKAPKTASKSRNANKKLIDGAALGHHGFIGTRLLQQGSGFFNEKNDRGSCDRLNDKFEKNDRGTEKLPPSNEALYAQFREGHTEFRNEMDAKLGRLHKLLEKVRSPGLEKTISDASINGTLAPELLIFFQSRPESITFANAGMVMNIVNFGIENEFLPALSTIEQVIQLLEAWPTITEESEAEKASKNITKKALKAIGPKIREIGQKSLSTRIPAERIINEFSRYLL